MTTIATASDSPTSVVVKESGAKGESGTDGTDGAGFNLVRGSKINNPLFHGFKKNSLNEVMQGVITWSRASTKTYIDRYGTLRYSGGPNTTNLCLRSEEFDNASWTKSSVTVTANDVDGPDGSATADKLEATGADSTVYQNITVTANTFYTFSVWLKADSHTKVEINFANTAGTENSRKEVTATTEWQRFEVTGTLTVTTGRVYIGGFSSFSTGEIVYAYGGQLDAARAANGYVQTTSASATDTSYVGLDQSCEETEGFLIEGATTNLCLRSEEFDNASWAKTSVTVTSNAVASPDGNTTADQLDAGATDSLLSQTVTVVNTETYTFSVWLRAGSALDVEINFNSTTDNRLVCSLTTEWQRFEVTGVASGTTATLYIGGFSSFSTGETIYVWGGQLENLGFATSYIPTTSASVARSADVVSAEGLNNAMSGNDPMSITCKFQMLGFEGSNRLFEINGSTQEILVFATSGGAISMTNGSDSNNFAQSAPFESTYDYCLTISSSEYNQFIDNVADDNNPVTPSSPMTEIPETIYFGNNSGAATAILNGHLRDFRIYDFVLNSNERSYIAGA